MAMEICDTGKSGNFFYRFLVGTQTNVTTIHKDVEMK